MQMGGYSLTNIESLPDELVFAILVRVPAQDIGNGARLVCRKWYRIMNSPNFICAHLQHSPPGLLVQCWCEAMHPIFVAMQHGRIEISELNYKFKYFSKGSCNGLVVDHNPMGIYVVNTTTEQHYALPPVSVEGVTYSCGVMAYAAASMEYKAVLTRFHNDTTSSRCCAILTVGVDRFWRHVDTKLLPITPEEFINGSALIAGGFIHWTDLRETRVFTFHVETEVFTSTPVPQSSERSWKFFLSTGRSLTVVVTCGLFLWEVWELKQESGGWMKLFKIDMEARKCRVQELVQKVCVSFLTHSTLFLEPVGWLNYGEVLVLQAFNPSRLCFLYNVRTQEIDSFELNHNCGLPYRFGFHRNSLVHLVV